VGEREKERMKQRERKRERGRVYVFEVFARCEQVESHDFKWKLCFADLNSKPPQV
jgi:hypothetical protein